MAAITALLHTLNDATRIGRALETLRPCDEILIVDHGSLDQTVRIARDYGARVLPAIIANREHAPETQCEWIFCLRPTESLSEGLEASLFEWKVYEEFELASVMGGAVVVREEDRGNWTEGAPELRLVRRNWGSWERGFPVGERGWMLLQGDLLRFRQP